LNKEKIILGIDPGTNIMGVGVLNIKGKLINCEKIEIIKLNKLKNHALKLKSIFIKKLLMTAMENFLLVS